MNKLILSFLALPLLLPAMTHAQAHSRLTAASSQTQDAGGVLRTTDSTIYVYSHNRGGDLVTTLKYDTSITLSYDTAAHVFKNSARSYQLFDAANNLLSTTSQVYSGGGWINRSKATYDKNAAGYDTVATQYLWITATMAFRPASRDLYQYNSANAVTVSIHQVYDTVGMAFVNYNRQLNYYNAAGDLSIDTLQFWNAAGSSWKTDHADYNTYSGRLLTQVRDTIFNFVSGYPNGTYRIYKYNSASFLISTNYYIQYNGGATVIGNDSTSYSNFTPGGNPQKAVVYIGAIFLYAPPAYEFNYTYNSLEQRTYLDFAVYASGISQPPGNSIHYYYEAYNLAAPSLSAMPLRLEIFPNPAAGMLSIRTGAIAAPVTLQIRDVAGRLWHSSVRMAGSGQQAEVSTAGLPDGCYLVSVSGAQGTAVERVVVRH